MVFGLVDVIYFTIHLSHILYGYSFLFCDYSFLFCYQFEMLIDFVFTVHHLLQLDAITVILLLFVFAVANRA